jgi:hypothetical protein
MGNNEHCVVFDRYLTRSDIAKILKVSPKQAGRLMDEMPVLQISKNQRRVAADDFQTWCNAKSMRSADAFTPGIRSRRAMTAREPLARTGRLIDAARSKTRCDRHPQP